MASLSINTTLKLASGYDIPQLGFGVSKDHIRDCTSRASIDS